MYFHIQSLMALENKSKANILLQWKYSNMAFVYRKQKQDSHNFNATSPGPGQYNAPSELNCTNSAVGFADRVPRKLWETSTTPGPGQYNSGLQAQQFNGFNTLISNPKLQLYVIDAISNSDGCTSMFKSTSKKLDHTTNTNPGPGYYEVYQQKPRHNNINNRRERSTKLSRYLYNQTKKNKEGEIITAFTGKLQMKQENKIHEKDSNKVEEMAQVHQQQPKYNYKSVFNSRVQRKIISRPQTSNGVGPGTYNIDQAYKNVDKKSFNCKSICQNASPNNQSRVIGPDGKMNKKDQKENVGPGSYQVEVSSFQRPQTSQSKGISCFGSKQSRFDQQFCSRPITPGPQSYFKPTLKNPNSKQEPKKVGFNSSTDKTNQIFYIVHSGKFNEVSPCSYNPKNDFNELLKKNYIKGSVGRFGSTVERFKDANTTTDDQSHLRMTDSIAIQCGSESKKKEVEKYKKFIPIKKTHQYSKIMRSESSTQMIDNRPLSYDTQFHTIAHKLSRKTQIEAPFMVASERFSEQQPCYEDYLASVILQSEANKQILIKGQNGRQPSKKSKVFKGAPESMSLFKKYKSAKQNIVTMISKQNKQSIIGPQTYDPRPLVKKSFNTLFKN